MNGKAIFWLSLGAINSGKPDYKCSGNGLAPDSPEYGEAFRTALALHRTGRSPDAWYGGLRAGHDPGPRFASTRQLFGYFVPTRDVRPRP